MKKVNAIFIMVIVFGMNVMAQTATVAANGNATGPGGSMSYSILQVDYFKAAGLSNPIQSAFEISTVTGIEVSNINLDIKVYPNPVTDYVILTMDNTKGMQYKVFDVIGNLLYNKQVTENITNINMHVPSGIYFISISNGNTDIKTFKVVKN
jgi:hypothetical protein